MNQVKLFVSMKHGISHLTLIKQDDSSGVDVDRGSSTGDEQTIGFELDLTVRHGRRFAAGRVALPSTRPALLKRIIG